jgi:6-phosphogluconolactonase
MPESHTERLELQVVSDADSAAREGAAFIAKLACQAVAQHGRFILAVSGGHTPLLMFEKLVAEAVAWASVHLIQVDERVAPLGDAARNLTSLQESLLAQIPLPRTQIYRMPVETDDLEAGACRYAEILQEISGAPPVFDLVHLGLGTDGHTASLAPGDPVLEIQDEDVAVTSVYQGWRRMTLTYPIINRARRILWLVTGAEKAEMLHRLFEGDTGIPSGRICRKQAVLLADQSAAALLVR